MGCVDKIGVSRTQFPREFVQCVVSNEDAVRDVERAVVCVELFDGGVPTGWIALPEDLLKVSIDKFSNSLSRSHIRVILRRGVSLSDAFGDAKRTAVLFHSASASSQLGSRRRLYRLRVAERFLDKCCRVCSLD